MTKPRKQRVRLRLIYQDTTPAAFLEGLYKNSPSAGLCEDEAGRIFQGRLMDELALLNKTWNGSTVSVDRKHESFRVCSPRCTISWMVQPSTFKKFMDRKGDEARGVGFLARCLVCYPETRQGKRPMSDYDQLPKAIEEFSARVTELLNDQIDFLRPRASEDDDE
jgi:hypothetical protein